VKVNKSAEGIMAEGGNRVTRKTLSGEKRTMGGGLPSMVGKNIRRKSEGEKELWKEKIGG